MIRRTLYLATTFFRRDLAVDAAYKAALALEGLDVILGAAASGLTTPFCWSFRTDRVKQVSVVVIALLTATPIRRNAKAS